MMFANFSRTVKRLFGAQAVKVQTILNDGCYIVRSVGLRAFGLSEVEISDCPSHLKDVASNLVTQIAKNGRSMPESLESGKTIGGRFVSSSQPLIEIFRLVRSGADSSALQVVDLEKDAKGFPYRLVATHLCATAGSFRREALRLLLVASEIWPKESTASNAALGDYEFNTNNFWTWIDLGTALAQVDKTDEAVERWKIAVCMWPRGGKLYASRMIASSTSTPSRGRSKRAVHDFWQSVGNDSIRGWCSELNVKLPADALAD